MIGPSYLLASPIHPGRAEPSREKAIVVEGKQVKNEVCVQETFAGLANVYPCGKKGNPGSRIPSRRSAGMFPLFYRRNGYTVRVHGCKRFRNELHPKKSRATFAITWNGWR